MVPVVEGFAAGVARMLDPGFFTGEGVMLLLEGELLSRTIFCGSD